MIDFVAETQKEWRFRWQLRLFRLRFTYWANSPKQRGALNVKLGRDVLCIAI